MGDNVKDVYLVEALWAEDDICADPEIIVCSDTDSAQEAVLELMARELHCCARASGELADAVQRGDFHLAFSLWQAEELNPELDITEMQVRISNAEQSREADKHRLICLAKDLGIEPVELDDDVHDNAHADGSDKNNAGIDEQVRFLVAQLGVEEVERIIRSKRAMFDIKEIT